MDTQNQAIQTIPSEEAVRWTRESVEAHIKACCGPEGLDLAGEDLSSVDLSGLDLHGVVLSRYDKENKTTVVATLQSPAQLHRANLRGAVMDKVYLRGAFLSHADLQGASLELANLQGADLRNANLQEANLKSADLQEADLGLADLQGADLDMANLHKIKLYRTKLHRTFLKREQLDPASVYEKPGTYSWARDIYLALKHNFDSLGDYGSASWAYRKERRVEKLWARQRARSARDRREWKEALASYRKFAGDQIVDCLCDYGEGVGRVLGWIALLLFVIGPGLIRLAGGLEWPSRQTDTFLSLPYRDLQCAYAYVQYVLFTLTFFGAAFSDLKPSNDVVRLVSGLIAMARIFLTGLLGFVAGNRIRRS